MFSDYKYPQMKGLTSFQGDLLHTANWPSAFNCDGKTVAVLGNGASGVQIVPAIQPGAFIYTVLLFISYC